MTVVSNPLLVCCAKSFDSVFVQSVYIFEQGVQARFICHAILSPRRLPLGMRRWAWTSRGLCSLQRMVEMHNVTEEEVFADCNVTTTLYQRLADLQRLPIVEHDESKAVGTTAFAPCKRVWAMANQPFAQRANVPESAWVIVPTFLADSIEQHIPHYNDKLAHLQEIVEGYKKTDCRKVSVRSYIRKKLKMGKDT